MDGKKTLVLRAEEISQDAEFKSSVDNLMEYREWNGKSLDEWIDLISVHSGINPDLARFASDEVEVFYVEVHNSQDINRKQLLKLVAQISDVNKRCTEKIGMPLVALMLL